MPYTVGIWATPGSGHDRFRVPVTRTGIGCQARAGNVKGLGEIVAQKSRATMALLLFLNINIEMSLFLLVVFTYVFIPVLFVVIQNVDHVLASKVGSPRFLHHGAFEP